MTPKLDAAGGWGEVHARISCSMYCGDPRRQGTPIDIVAAMQDSTRTLGECGRVE